MTLFITTPRRQLAISDAYVMAFAMIISFWVTRIIKQLIEKKKQGNEKTFNATHVRGGGELKVQFSEEDELGKAILSCIEDNQNYLVTNPKIKELIFSLVKENVRRESLVLSPNLIRFLALQLIKKDRTLIIKFANIVVSSKNRVRLLTRTLGSIAIGIIGALASTFPYAILLTIIYFIETENCGYNCEAHFQKLPQNQPIEIYAEHQNGNLIISGNDDARQVEIYTPLKPENKLIESNKKTGEKIVHKSYKITRKKAKEVQFSEFRKNDPVLSQFKDLDEPHIPTRSCNLQPEDLHDLIDIRIDN